MWYRQLQARYLQYDTPLTLSPVFRNNILTVDAALDQYAALPYGRRTYKYVGRLTPIFNQPEVGLHRGRSRRLFLGNYQIQFDNPLNYEFALELSIHLWTPQLDITIWQSEEEEIVNIGTELIFVESGIARIEEKIDELNTRVPK